MDWGARTMRTSQLILIAVTVTSLVACAYFAYQVLDLSVTVSHAAGARAALQKQRDLLRELAIDLTKKTKRADIKEVLESTYAKKHLVKDEDRDTILVDGIGLKFRGDELVDIVFVPSGN
jgi:uncharacterized protein YpuA (DUF1002 family)